MAAESERIAQFFGNLVATRFANNQKRSLCHDFFSHCKIKSEIRIRVQTIDADSTQKSTLHHVLFLLPARTFNEAVFQPPHYNDNIRNSKPDGSATRTSINHSETTEAE